MVTHSKARLITAGTVKKGGVNTGSSNLKPNVKPIGQAPKPQQPPTTEFVEALKAIKNDLRILTALQSQLAAASISFKLIDCLTSITKSDFKQAILDAWACSCVVRRNLYASMSERYAKSSNRATAAECAVSDCDYKLASEQYMKAIVEITAGTNISVIFEEPNNGNS